MIEEILEESLNLILSDNDRDLFLSLLENPPKPNKKLETAYSEYKKK